MLDDREAQDIGTDNGRDAGASAGQPTKTVGGDVILMVSLVAGGRVGLSVALLAFKVLVIGEEVGAEKLVVGAEKLMVVVGAEKLMVVETILCPKARP